MSGNIPLELQAEIIKRVPVKTLLRFRSVSKEWKSVIDSPDFADDYCALQSQPHRLLITYVPIVQDEQFTTVTSYLTIAADDDTFQQHQIPSTALPKFVNNFKDSIMVGCSHGLVCFYAYDNRDGSPMSVLWNPWIRKFVDVRVPNVLFTPYQTILGFGVSPQTKDPMIVKINSSYSCISDTSVPIPWRVEVFNLSAGTWKSPSGSINNLPSRNSIIFQWSQVALDGVIYWHAFEMINVDGRPSFQNLIMSFDLSSEEFEEVCLPNNLAQLHRFQFHISKRMESVVVLERDETGTSYGVWMMTQGVTKSFTKLFTVMARVVSPYCIVHGFRKNGEPIVYHGSDALFAYDSNSERIKDLGIVGVGHDVHFSVMSYMETLLLIDQ